MSICVYFMAVQIIFFCFFTLFLWSGERTGEAVPGAGELDIEPVEKKGMQLDRSDYPYHDAHQRE